MSTNEPRAVDEAPTRRRLLALVLAALLLAPFVVSAIRLVFAIGGSYLPVSDHAVIEFNVRDVGHHSVLVGLYSRFGWFHPGPLIFYLLAVPYRLLGSRSIGMWVGALVINGAAVAGCLAVARRRAGTPLLVCTALGLTVFMRASGADFLRDPWTPYVAVLPLLFLVFLAWSVVDGTVWALPWVVGVATFVVQTHIGFAPVALSLVLWSLVVSCVRTFRARRDRTRSAPLRTPFLVALGTAVVLWAPPVYAQFFSSDHNMGKILHYFTNSGPGAGWSTAWKVMDVQLGLRPEWALGPRSPILGGLARGATGVAVPWLLVFGAGAAVVAVRLRHRGLGMLLATLLVATASGVYAISAVTGTLFPYLVRWAWVIGLGWGIAVLWALWLCGSRLLAPRVRSARALLGGAATVAVVAVAVLAVAACVTAIDSPGPQASGQALIRSVSQQAVAKLSSGHGPVIFVGTNGGMDEIPIALQLERHGIPVLFSDFNGDVVRNRRPHAVRWRALLTVVTGPDAVNARTPPHQILVARASHPYPATDVANARLRVRVMVERYGSRSRRAEEARRALRPLITPPGRVIVVFAQLPAS
jgi:hypothetical protein